MWDQGRGVLAGHCSVELICMHLLVNVVQGCRRESLLCDSKQHFTTDTLDCLVFTCAASCVHQSVLRLNAQCVSVCMVLTLPPCTHADSFLLGDWLIVPNLSIVAQDSGCCISFSVRGATKLALRASSTSK